RRAEAGPELANGQHVGIIDARGGTVRREGRQRVMILGNGFERRRPAQLRGSAHTLCPGGTEDMDLLLAARDFVGMLVGNARSVSRMDHCLRQEDGQKCRPWTRGSASHASSLGLTGDGSMGNGKAACSETS